jgi:hypothetical protein
MQIVARGQAATQSEVHSLDPSAQTLQGRDSVDRRAPDRLDYEPDTLLLPKVKLADGLDNAM